LNGIDVSKMLSFPVFNDFKVAIVVIMPDKRKYAYEIEKQ